MHPGPCPDWRAPASGGGQKGEEMGGAAEWWECKRRRAVPGRVQRLGTSFRARRHARVEQADPSPLASPPLRPKIDPPTQTSFSAAAIPLLNTQPLAP
eukprot:scaffold5235_cov95-Isochrysis_galbana.AAC.1